MFYVWLAEVFQHVVELLARRPVKWNLPCVAVYEALCRYGEAVAIVQQEVAILLLPFVAMRFDPAGIKHMGFEMCQFVEQHQKKELSGEIAINAYGMIGTFGCGSAIVAILATTAGSDTNVYAAAHYMVHKSVNSTIGRIFRYTLADFCYCYFTCGHR